MAGLFSNIISVASRSGQAIPWEDYFTEIFAYVLSQDSALLMDWVRTWNVIDEELIDNNSTFVLTQEDLGRLEKHSRNSIVDLWIKIQTKNGPLLIFSEHKVDSKEGHRQLPRYAEHLDHRGPQKGILVYITKDHDPKIEDNIFENCQNPQNLHFVPLRWRDVHNFLKSQERNNELVKELISYMEESGMTVSNKFSPTDLIALSSFPKVQAMMDEVLQGKVSEKLQKEMKVIRNFSVASTQLRILNRYVLESVQDWGLGVLLGFWCQDLSEGRYPEFGIEIYVGPKSGKRKEVISDFNKIVEKDGWHGYNLDLPSHWAGVFRKLSMDQIISKENHIEGIREYFLERIEELHGFKIEFPSLPWKS